MIFAVRVFDFSPIWAYQKLCSRVTSNLEPSIAVFSGRASTRFLAVVFKLVDPDAVVDAALLDASLEMDASERLTCKERSKEESEKGFHCGGLCDETFIIC
jgi:hypothetical protein